MMHRDLRLTKLIRILEITIATLWVFAGAFAAPDEPLTVSANRWTLIADPFEGVVNVMHDGLGTVMKNVRLQLRSANGLRSAKDWRLVKNEHQLSIQTGEPRTAWLFDLTSDALVISSTSTSAILTAEAPAAAGRVVVRALDSRGTPVTWVGTDEVKNGYSGTETRNQSFLPARNPEVMYFRLGQVSASVFHTLFDIKTDTIIEFTTETLMERDMKNQDLLDITMPVPGNAVLKVTPEYFTKSLGLPFYTPFDDSHFTTAPALWGSWTSYYGEVKETDIVRNTEWVASHLLPYGFQYIVLDDGYDGRNNVNRSVGENHSWIGEWDREKFPHGPKWLADYIKSKGLHAGLWIVPNAYAAAVEQHSDWYLRDRAGKIIRDYNTPALDSTNPEVLDFLKKLFTTLDAWGFEYYKFDGEHALSKYIPAVDRSRLYDKSADPVEAYRARLKLIREVTGPGTFIEGCPAGTPLNGIGYFNSYFNGEDVYNSWQGMYTLFSSINANAFLNHVVVYVMPGEGIELTPPMTVEEAREKRPPSVVQTAQTREDPLAGFGTTLEEARTLVTYLSLTGVVYPIASVMAELPDERVKLMKMTLPTMPIFPIDLFSRGTDAKFTTFRRTQPDYYIHNYPEILDLKVNAASGVYDVVGLTNWRSQKESREISFAGKLGLDRNAHYIVFDFWAQKLLGTFDDRITIDIEPHDTRTLLIHPLLNRPQLIGTTRHITGAYSIRSLDWDRSQNRLYGSSQAIPGESYILQVYVPNGMKPSQARAATADGRTVFVHHELHGNLLSVSLDGRKEPVGWEVGFVTNAR